MWLRGISRCPLLIKPWNTPTTNIILKRQITWRLLIYHVTDLLTSWSILYAKKQRADIYRQIFSGHLIFGNNFWTSLQMFRVSLKMSLKVYHTPSLQKKIFWRTTSLNLRLNMTSPFCQERTSQTFVIKYLIFQSKANFLHTFIHILRWPIRYLTLMTNEIHLKYTLL